MLYLYFNHHYFELIYNYYHLVINHFELLNLLAQSNQNQLGTFGEFSCKVAEKMSAILPESPVQLGEIVDDAGENLEFIGAHLMYQVGRDLYTVLMVVVPFKIIKFFPKF